MDEHAKIACPCGSRLLIRPGQKGKCPKCGRAHIARASDAPRVEKEGAETPREDNLYGFVFEKEPAEAHVFPSQRLRSTVAGEGEGRSATGISVWMGKAPWFSLAVPLVLLGAAVTQGFQEPVAPLMLWLLIGSLVWLRKKGGSSKKKTRDDSNSMFITGALFVLFGLVVAVLFSPYVGVALFGVGMVFLVCGAIMNHGEGQRELLRAQIESGTLEGKLEELKRLLDKGMITPQEHDQRRRALMERF